MTRPSEETQRPYPFDEFPDKGKYWEDVLRYYDEAGAKVATLLAACEMALKALNNPDSDDYFDGETLEAALETAIAKAKGVG